MPLYNPNPLSGIVPRLGSPGGATGNGFQSTPNQPIQGDTSNTSVGGRGGAPNPGSALPPVNPLASPPSGRGGAPSPGSALPTAPTTIPTQSPTTPGNTPMGPSSPTNTTSTTPPGFYSPNLGMNVNNGLTPDQQNTVNNAGTNPLAFNSEAVGGASYDANLAQANVFDGSKTNSQAYQAYWNALTNNGSGYNANIANALGMLSPSQYAQAMSDPAMMQQFLGNVGNLANSNPYVNGTAAAFGPQYNQPNLPSGGGAPITQGSNGAVNVPSQYTYNAQTPQSMPLSNAMTTYGGNNSYGNAAYGNTNNPFAYMTGQASNGLNGGQVTMPSSWNPNNFNGQGTSNGIYDNLLATLSGQNGNGSSYAQLLNMVLGGLGIQG